MSSVRIREASEKDAFGMARVRVDTWRSAYQGIVPADFLANLSYENTAERWTKVFWEERDSQVAVFVAEEGDHIVGIAMCGPEQNRDPEFEGEIYVLYVLPQHQNRGIGRKLVAACVNHLIDQLHVHTMLIWVLRENPYRRFYESLGGKAVKEKTREIGGKLISELGYGWPEIRQLR